MDARSFPSSKAKWNRRGRRLGARRTCRCPDAPPVPESPLAVSGFGRPWPCCRRPWPTRPWPWPAVGHHHPPRSHYAGNGKPKHLDGCGFLGDPQAVVNPSAVASRPCRQTRPMPAATQRQPGRWRPSDPRKTSSAIHGYTIPTAAWPCVRGSPFTARSSFRWCRIAPLPSEAVRPRHRHLGRHPFGAVAQHRTPAGLPRRRRQG